MICLSLSRMDCLWSLPDEVALSSSTRRLIGSGSALLNSAARSVQGNGSSFNNSVVRAVLDTTLLPGSIAGFQHRFTNPEGSPGVVARIASCRLSDCVKKDEVHFVEAGEGSPLICLDWLLKSI